MLKPFQDAAAAAAAAAKSLQSCSTLCNPIDDSLSGSPVPGILQAICPHLVCLKWNQTSSIRTGLIFPVPCFLSWSLLLWQAPGVKSLESSPAPYTSSFSHIEILFVMRTASKDIPGDSAIKTSCSQCQGAWVPSLGAQVPSQVPLLPQVPPLDLACCY